MCLTTNQKKPLIARTDITVYKVLDDSGAAPYHSEYQYYRGKTHQDKRDEVIYDLSFSKQIHGGYLHAYTTINDAEDLAQHFNDGVFRYDLDWMVERHFVVTEMKIPAGTQYYVSQDGRQICAKTLAWDCEQKKRRYSLKEFIGLLSRLSIKKK